MSAIAEHGPFLRVEEAAGLLRISRGSCPAVTRRSLRADGGELRSGPRRCDHSTQARSSNPTRLIATGSACSRRA